LWGGRFNPVIIVDQEELAEELIDVFRIDMIVPVGDSETVQSFSQRFKYLINPFLHGGVFLGEVAGASCSQVLDIHNALVHLQTKPEWEAVKRKGVHLYSWAPDDPLADVFLVQFGQYPSVEETGIDYRNLFMKAASATETNIESTAKLPAELLDYPSISFLSRYGLSRHYSVPSGRDEPGFYSGDARNLDDLICYWNLRAADIPLLFVDPRHLDRYGNMVEIWDKEMRDMAQRRRYEFERRVAVWVREEIVDRGKMIGRIAEILKPFGDREFTLGIVGPGSFNGLNVRPPMMYFGQVSTLGVVGTEFGKPKVTFPLDSKPFCSDTWFHTQHLVASVSFIGGLSGDEQHILVPPYIPELNEFYARTQHFEYNKLRSEPDRIGLVIDAADPSSFIYALVVSDLFERIFEMEGFKSRLSTGGLIARQLIAQLGGVDGGRAFKIPGVRRLIKTHGPVDPFTKNTALQLIAGKDPDNPSAKFTDYENLYIEPRAPGTKLEPEAVFTYLVEKGLFRIGTKLKCPNCRMDSWTALDMLKQKLVCDLCGREFDATRQLMKSTWHYRRSGLLGAERNAQGAVPVLVTLQQFDVNFRGLWDNSVYSPSLDLESNTLGDPPKCEIDFVWLIPRSYPDRTVVILGECKDRGSKKEGKDTGTIDEKDIENLRRVADALHGTRLETFIALVKLCPFTADEIALAKTLNSEYRQRVILLTARELEPYHFYERTKLEYKNIKEYGSRPEDLANNTAIMYFR
jgi:hypothetical protein